MAAFDANLLLLNNAAVASTGGVALMTGAFVDLGTGGTSVAGNAIRFDLNTADAVASTFQVTYQFSDNSSTVQEQIVTVAQTGTDARTAGGVELVTPFATKRRYVRYRATLTGAAASFTGTAGVTTLEFPGVR